MKYLLKNKDSVVLEFEVSIKESFIQTLQEKSYTNEISDIKIIDKKLLPKSIDIQDLANSLTQWINGRKAPKNREFIDEIVATYSHTNKQEGLMDYIDISLGLSLNDSYWIIPANQNYEWQKYNLYTNDFDKALELVAFSGNSHKANKITSSPEYTTNGMLKKCWHRENGQIYLYKGCVSANYKQSNVGKEAYSEYYMAQIAKVLGFEHISYDLREFHGQLVSTCPIFTNENEGYIAIYYLLDKQSLQKRGLETIDPLSNIYGKESLQNLMFFDSVICNKDRHLGNFGMIIDNNTNELLRPAPIFDNGFSMINFLKENELNNIAESIKKYQSKLDKSFDEQMRLFVQPRHIPNLEKLQTFEFKKHKEFNLPDEWLESIQKAIQDRAKLAIELCHKKPTIPTNQ
ncbi:transcriptional regulator [Helicobacter sp. MIT 01-3238]|uniref:transcriptional regulator n=1 Tax=Helicobacter sp. MIT 01-3238 TaxID=398627 RepID=UPI0015F18F96|nr:transcriptional regulator [Helicobacter sp. MIT 01-3238]